MTKNILEVKDLGISFDQEIGDNFGIFVRYAWQNPERRLNGLDADFSLEHSWSTGLQFSGIAWGRDDDLFAIAYGQVIPSDDYRNAGTNLNARSEDHLEAYYSVKVNDHLTISPDIQVIQDPYGGDAVNGNSTLVIGGLRIQIDF